MCIEFRRFVSRYTFSNVMSIEAESKSNRGGRRRTRNRREISAVFSMQAEPLAGRIPRPPDNQIYRVVSSGHVQNAFSSAVGAETDYGKSFSMNDLTTGAVGNFDQYRIDWIEAWLYARNSNNSTASTNFGILASAVDYDNSAAQTLANLELYQNVLLGSGIIGRYHAWKPHAAVSMGTTAAGVASGGNVESPWLDTANLNLAHFGLKAAITATDQIYVFDLAFRFHISYRNPI